MVKLIHIREHTSDCDQSNREDGCVLQDIHSGITPERDELHKGRLTAKGDEEIGGQQGKQNGGRDDIERLGAQNAAASHLIKKSTRATRRQSH